MIHVLAQNGQRLRLRIYPRPKAKVPATGKAAAPTLFQDHADAAVAAVTEKLALRIVEVVLCNRFNSTILERFPQLGIRDWWLTAGCIVQTVWNMRSARSPERGIRDYDILYYADDPSWEAEDEVIREAARLFTDLPVTLQVRNQARVHLWYPEKYGTAVSPLTSASDGILRFPSTTAAVGLKRTGEEFLDVYAPFGLSNIWDLTVKPNRALPIPHVYAEKIERWRAEWPRLKIEPWSAESDD
jgi:hypothetical protein